MGLSSFPDAVKLLHLSYTNRPPKIVERNLVHIHIIPAHIDKKVRHVSVTNSGCSRPLAVYEIIDVSSFLAVIIRTYDVNSTTERQIIIVQNGVFRHKVVFVARRQTIVRDGCSRRKKHSLDYSLRRLHYAALTQT